MGTNLAACKRGWHWDGVNEYLSANVNGVEAFRIDNTGSNGYFRMVNTTEAQGDPGKQLNIERTYIGTMTAGKAQTGLQVSSTWTGAANCNSSEMKGCEIKARGNSTGTYSIGNMRAIVGNCDAKKTDVPSIARVMELVFENQNGSTCAEVYGIDVKLQASGVMTASYVAYFHGHSASYANYGIYVRYVKYGILVETIDAAGSQYGIKVSDTLTTTAAIAHRAIDGIVTYTPSTVTSGGSVPIGVAGKVILSTTCETDLYMWGVQGQLHFTNGSIITCSQIAAGRFVLTADANPTVTSGLIAGVYVDNLVATDLNGGAGYSDLIRLANHGGIMDNAIDIYGPNTTYFVRFNGCEIGGCISTNATTSGTSRKIKCDVDGTPYYINIYTG